MTSESWGSLLEIGEHSYGVPNIHVFGKDRGRVVVGDWCSIAPDVEIILGGNHSLSSVTSFPLWREFPEAKRTGWGKGGVEIGNDVWIGQGARIVDGIRIGDGAAVAAWSTVTRDVEPYALVGGNPAQLIRKRFTDDQIVRLLEIRWWDWPEDLIAERIEELSSEDIGGFLSAYAETEPNC